MPPTAVKKPAAVAAATTVVTAAVSADDPLKAAGAEKKTTLKENKAPKEPKEPKEKKEVKDPAKGTAKIMSFFTKKPATAAPETPATPAATKDAPVAAKSPAASKTPPKNAEVCILLDSDSEGTAKDGSNTPPTAMKKAEAGKKNGKNLADTMKGDKDGVGDKASVGKKPVAAGSTDDAAASAAKVVDGKVKPEGKKKSARPAKTDSKDAKAKDEVSKARQGTLCFQPGLCSVCTCALCPLRFRAQPSRLCCCVRLHAHHMRCFWFSWRRLLASEYARRDGGQACCQGLRPAQGQERAPVPSHGRRHRSFGAVCDYSPVL